MSDGLPTKYNQKRKKLLIDAAEKGALKKDIAAFAGISHDTLNNWLNRGEEEEGTELSEFSEQFTQARGRGAVNQLEDAGAEFILERSYGYTKSQEIEHSGEGGVMVVPGMADEDEWEEEVNE